MHYIFIQIDKGLIVLELLIEARVIRTTITIRVKVVAVVLIAIENSPRFPQKVEPASETQWS